MTAIDDLTFLENRRYTEFARREFANGYSIEVLRSKDKRSFEVRLLASTPESQRDEVKCTWFNLTEAQADEILAYLEAANPLDRKGAP